MIKAIIFSHQFGDYLEHTLPINKQTFDEVHVCTTEFDEETIDVCKKNNVPYIAIPHFDSIEEGDFTWRGFGLNQLLTVVPFNDNDWIVQIDADTCLMPQMKPYLKRYTWETNRIIYGCDRYLVPDISTFRKYVDDGWKMYSDYGHFLYLDHFPVGTRMHLKYFDEANMPLSQFEYVPLGFFQMWKYKHEKAYPIFHKGKRRIDAVHALEFYRRQLIPEVIAYHIGETGVHHKGRVR